MKNIFFAFQNIANRGFKERIERTLKFCDMDTDARLFIGFSLAFSISAGFVAAFLKFSFYGSGALEFLVLWGISCLLIFGLTNGMLLFIADRRTKFTENILPDVLQIMSANMRSGMTPDRALLLSARPEFHPLQKEIKMAAKRVVGGISLEESFRSMTEKINSSMLKRAVDLIVEGMRSGGEIAFLLDECANDIRETQSMKKLISASVMMYSIFIFIAVGFGAPTLYAMSYFLVDTMSQLGSGVSMPENASSMAFSGFNIDIEMETLLRFIYASMGITCVFGGIVVGIIQSGNEKAGIKYILMLLLTSFVVFSATKYVISTVMGSIMI